MTKPLSEQELRDRRLMRAFHRGQKASTADRKCPFSMNTTASEHNEWDAWCQGKARAEAFARGVNEFHRYGGFEKQNPYARPHKKHIITGDIDKMMESLYEWQWFEAGYQDACGDAEFETDEQYRDALCGELKESYPLTEDQKREHAELAGIV